MKIIITGATGFVGKWLVKEALKQDDEVTIIVRNKECVPVEWIDKVHIIQASLEQFQELDVKDFPVKSGDIFFHLAWDGAAGMGRADISLQLKNVQSTCDAVKLAKRMQCRRFVNAGSLMEYEAMKYILQEGAIPGMGNIYSIAKQTADFMAKTVATKEEIDYINVIISNIYGPGETSPRFLNMTLRKMLKDEEVQLTHGKQLYDFIYVSDAVKAILLVGKCGVTNTSYYIGNTIQHPLKEFVIKIKEVLESKSELLFGVVPFVGAMLTYQEFDTNKMEQLGFKAEVSFEQGIKLTRDWILEEDFKYID